MQLAPAVWSEVHLKMNSSRTTPMLTLRHLTCPMALRPWGGSYA
jgi:hypothetical protein